MPSKEELMRAREADNRPQVKGVKYNNTHSNGQKYSGHNQGGRKGHRERG